MRIAFFTETYHPQINGVTVSVDNFATSLRKKAHVVYIFAPKIKGYKDTDKNILRLSSIKVISAEPEARLPLLVPNKSIRQMFRLNFDLIHAHGNGAFSLLGYQAAMIKRVPFILTFHTLHTKYTHYFLNGKLIKPNMVAKGLRVFGNLCDGVITPSEKMKKELVSYGVKKPIKVIPSFIDFSKFQGRKKGYLHKKFSILQESPILLSVGRLGKEKNFDFIIKTFQKLSRKDEKVHLVIVGQGLEKLNLKNLARTLGVGSKVHFTGRVDAKLMPSVYADATIFVFASDTETQGICVLEAASAGLSLVVVKDLAFENIVKDGKNGFSLPLDQGIFTAKIEQLLKEPGLRHKFGEYSRKLAKENSQPEALTSELTTFYNETINRYKTRERILKKIANKVALIKLINATEVLNRFLLK